jgi:ssRNA-specific RNase YbeY (16S rRNA maturation enzyme)
MLHLRGFDDRTAIGYRKMHAMEDRVLERLGIGPIFHVSADQKAGRAG